MEESEAGGVSAPSATSPTNAMSTKAGSPSNLSPIVSPAAIAGLGPGPALPPPTNSFQAGASPDHMHHHAVATAAELEAVSRRPSSSSAPKRHRSRSIKRTLAGSRSDTGDSTSSQNVYSVAGTSATSSSVASGSRSHHHSIAGTRPRREKHQAALESIRKFLRGRSSYDVLPVSFRLVVLDTKLVVKPALDVMWQCGIVSAPLWQSASAADTDDEGLLEEDMRIHEGDKPEKAEAQSAAVKSGFAGMLTVNDIIHLIQYYYKNSSYDNASKDVETFRLEKLKDIEKSLQVPQPPTLSVHPLRSLYEACQLIIRTHARRLPLIDHDEQTGIETVLSVLTQYRVLKFIAMNCRETAVLHRSIRSLGIGTYVDTTSDPLSRQGTAERAAEPDASTVGGVAASVDVSMDTNGEETTNTIQDERGMQTPIAEVPPISPFATAAEQPVASADQEATSQDPLASSTSSTTPSTAHARPNPYAPLATATLDTTVFDVVHMFSELGISSVPILDCEGGNVVDLYEAVDVVQLVRTGAYQALDLTIRQALARRPSDFPGVITCSPDDSLANIFALLRRRRVHRLLILEPDVHGQEEESHHQGSGRTAGEEDTAAATTGEEGHVAPPTPPPVPMTPRELEDQLELGFMRKRQQGKLAGILCLSDILRYVIGEADAERSASTPSTGGAPTSAPQTSNTSIAASPSGSWLHYQIPSSSAAASREGSGQNTAADGNSPFPSLPASASGSVAHLSAAGTRAEEMLGAKNEGVEGAAAASGTRDEEEGGLAAAVDLTDDTPTMEEPEPSLQPFDPAAETTVHDTGDAAAR